ncbi:MAG: radical SAM protein [Planctomycetota bacterium]|nr:radical SAM protein [Planctomycetota bacterium]
MARSDNFVPGYVKLHRSGELTRRADEAWERLSGCRMCPRRCGADRLGGKTGVCRTGAKARVSSFGPHFGEEDVLVGTGGSGTIFFSSCNLLCCFCQNYEISHFPGEGREVGPEELARIMLTLQGYGCHNINFVTPSHVVPQILRSLIPAVEMGLRVPLVYNSSGYDEVETLRLLDGVFDIYMPDFKFWDPEVADELCGAPDYPDAAREALKEMHRQVGPLETGAEDVAYRGLLVRHLVMPDGLASTAEIAKFLAEEISPDTFVNVMAQYRPRGRAHTRQGLNRGITPEEYTEALEAVRRAGLRRAQAQ